MLGSKALEELVRQVDAFRAAPEPSTTTINNVMGYIDSHAAEFVAAPPEYRMLVEITLHNVDGLLRARRDRLAPSFGAVNSGRLYDDQFDRINRIVDVMGIPHPESSRYL